jgi:hypothetical protein
MPRSVDAMRCPLWTGIASPDRAVDCLPPIPIPHPALPRGVAAPVRLGVGLRWLGDGRRGGGADSESQIRRGTMGRMGRASMGSMFVPEGASLLGSTGRVARHQANP